MSQTLPSELIDQAQLPARVWPRRELRGEMGFSISHREGRSYALRQTHKGYMRVIRPHYLDDSGQVYYTMINPGGGFFGGDDYRLDVHMGEGSAMVLTDQSATTVYKTPDDYCLQEINIVMEPDSVLEFVPSQLIAYRGATYHQHVRVDMDPTASVVLSDVITPGWSPDKLHFDYDEVRVRTAINIDGEPKVLDNLLVRPASGSVTEDALLFMENMTHLGTVLAVDQRIDEELIDALREVLAEAEEKVESTIPWAISLLDAPGLAVRVLGTHTDEIRVLLNSVIDHLRGEFRSQGPLELRKQ